MSNFIVIGLGVCALRGHENDPLPFKPCMAYNILPCTTEQNPRELGHLQTDFDEFLNAGTYQQANLKIAKAEVLTGYKMAAAAILKTIKGL